MGNVVNVKFGKEAKVVPTPLDIKIFNTTATISSTANSFDNLEDGIYFLMALIVVCCEMVIESKHYNAPVLAIFTWIGKRVRSRYPGLNVPGIITAPIKDEKHE